MDTRTEIASTHTAAGPSANVYRITFGWRLTVAIILGALLCAALAGIYHVLATFGELPTGRTLLVVLILVMLTAGMVWQLVIFLTWQVMLTPNAIETSSWWRSRGLNREDVDGYRINSTGRSGQILLVVPAVKGLKTVRLALRFMEKDAFFVAWFAGLRDLNAEDRRRSVAEIATNDAFGATPEQRLRRLARARKVAGALDFLAIGVVAWCFIAPQPYALVIGSLAALPVLALILVVLSRGLLRIGVGATHAHANVGSACAVPAFALMLRLLFDLNMVDWMPLIGIAVAGAAVFIAALAMIDRGLRRRPWMLLGLALVTGAYGLGAIGEANALLDRSPLSALRSRVVAKRFSYGKATTYHLTLAPWGPLSAPRDVTVPHEVYDRLEPDSPACVLLHDGAFGMLWFIVLDCR